MASTTTLVQISITLQRARATREASISRNPFANTLQPHRPPPRLHGLTFSTRRRTPFVTSKKKRTPKKAGGDEEDIDEAAFEALFQQLEEDLKNDELNGTHGEDDDISEEDLAKLEQELAEALQEDDELLGAPDNEDEDEENDDEDNEYEVDDDNEELALEDDDDDDDEIRVELKNWQLKRLAYALKKGRRKTAIKSLAADVCLDRAIVLSILRDPPPNLVLLSATLPDEPIVNTIETAAPSEPMADTTKPQVKEEEKLPVHVMQRNWSARKRLKKAQVETLEQVYRRTKRPTNTMISSIVHITNLPRKKVVKWFEDKRAEEGVPEHRLPYQRSTRESVFTN